MRFLLTFINVYSFSVYKMSYNLTINMYMMLLLMLIQPF